MRRRGGGDRWRQRDRLKFKLLCLCELRYCVSSLQLLLPHVQLVQAHNEALLHIPFGRGGERFLVTGCGREAPPRLSAPRQCCVLRCVLRCCSDVGGAQLCLVDGCGRRARFYGKCTRHGGFQDCAEPGCGLRAVSRGRCARHGGKRHCRHPGCDRLRARAKDEWCQAHARSIALLRAELGESRLAGWLAACPPCSPEAERLTPIHAS